MKVAIVGAGLVGRGWAVVFARAGHEVALFDAQDPGAERALAAIAGSLRDLEAEGLTASAADALANVRPAASLEEAVTAAAAAQESVPEVADAKREVFLAMDAAAPPDALLLSSTSAIPGSTFLESVPGRHRCLVAHPANPPHLMPIVEVVPTPFNPPEIVARTRALYESVGQVPVTVRGEVEGFAMNRMQTAAMNEAMALVARGAITPADLDKVMRYSLGLRWSFMGPFETADLNAPAGFRDYARRYRGNFDRLGAQLETARPWDDTTIEAVDAALRARVSAPELEARQRWRDRRLMGLLREIRRADDAIGT